MKLSEPLFRVRLLKDIVGWNFSGDILPVYKVNYKTYKCLHTSSQGSYFILVKKADCEMVDERLEAKREKDELEKQEEIHQKLLNENPDYKKTYEKMQEMLREFSKHYK